MQYRIVLEEISSGKRIEFIERYPDGFDEQFADFYWTEGNMCCDCNKHRYFYPDDDNHIPCGDDKYKTISVEKL